MLNSYYQELGPVILPSYQSRQKYMHTFDLAKPVMAVGFEDYLPIVTQLCILAKATMGLAHMTVDEKVVVKGMSQRRPKPHVDGCFIPTAQMWGHGPGWNHYCNNTGDAIGRMPVIVAANKVGCKCYSGSFEGKPCNDGDLSHIALPFGEILQPNMGYLLSPDCVHESLPMIEDTERTFLRIALPLDYTL